MLTEKRLQKDLAEAITDENAFKLSAYLEAMDKLLEDERLIEPIKVHFSKDRGRPSIALDTYLRMMVIKHYYGIGYKRLIEEVRYRIDLRYFCRIGLKDKVPDESTLKKITKKIGEDTIKRINEALVKKMSEANKFKKNKIRVDTTVIRANISYPTDASLLYKVVKGVARYSGLIKDTLKLCKARVVNRSKESKKKLIEVVRYFRGSGRKEKEFVRGKIKEMVEISRKAIKESRKAINILNEKIKGASSELRNRAGKFIERYNDFIELSEKVVEQSEKISKGLRIKASKRILSLNDKDARAMIRGKRKDGVEFGYKAIISTDEDGLVSNYKVINCNASDKKLLKEALQAHIDTLGKTPKAIAADSGFYSLANEQYCKHKGIKRICIPKPGKKSRDRLKIERSRWFKNLKRFRAAIEANISLMKRKFGLRKTLMVNLNGASLWAGLCIFTYNLYKVAINARR